MQSALFPLHNSKICIVSHKPEGGERESGDFFGCVCVCVCEREREREGAREERDAMLQLYQSLT